MVITGVYRLTYFGHVIYIFPCMYFGYRRLKSLVTLVTCIYIVPRALTKRIDSSTYHVTYSPKYLWHVYRLDPCMEWESRVSHVRIDGRYHVTQLPLAWPPLSRGSVVLVSHTDIYWTSSAGTMTKNPSPGFFYRRILQRNRLEIFPIFNEKLIQYTVF